MNEPIKHHYVPQWYMREWCSSDGKLQCFMRLPTRALNSRRYSPKAIAFETNLYSWANPNHPNPQDLEKEFFQTIDREGARVSKILRLDGVKALSDNDRKHWAHFLGATILRLPREIKSIKNESQRIVMESVKDFDKVEQVFPGFSDDRGLRAMKDFIEDDEHTKIWTSFDWWVQDISRAEFSLLTSDKPLILLGIQQQDDGIIAFLPLSPNTLFCATNNSLFKHLIMQGKADFAANWSNNLQIKYARNFLIAKDESLSWHIERFFGDDFPDPPLP
jgi:hypothetical protein